MSAPSILSQDAIDFSSKYNTNLTADQEAKQEIIIKMEIQNKKIVQTVI